MEKKIVDNFLRFKLNDNLKRFINEVETTQTLVDNSVDDILRSINASRYDIHIHSIEQPIIMSDYQCKVDLEKRVVEVTKTNSSTIKSFENFTIHADEIMDGRVKFINTHFSQPDETYQFRYLFTQNTNTPKFSYEFNTEAFRNIPEINGDSKIIMFGTLFTVEQVTPYAISLRANHNGNKYYRSPMDLLVDDVYPLHNMDRFKRTEDGLLIPKLKEIIPICEYIKDEEDI